MIWGVGGGRGVQDWELMYTRGGFMSMYGKNQYSIVQQNLKKKRENASDGRVQEVMDT